MRGEPAKEQLQAVLKALPGLFEQLGPLRYPTGQDLSEQTGLTADVVEQVLRTLARNRMIEARTASDYTLILRVTGAGAAFASAPDTTA